MAHTTGKIYTEHDGDGHESNHEHYLVAAGGGGRFATMETPHDGDWRTRRDNAARVAALWNLCDGLTLEQVRAAVRGVV